MKLQYWLIQHKTDPKKSIRSKTRRTAELDYTRLEARGEINAADYIPAKRVVYSFANNTDLLFTLVKEGFVEAPHIVENAPREKSNPVTEDKKNAA